MTFSAVGRDGPSIQAVVLQVCDDNGACATSGAIVNITNVAPALEGMTGPLDPVQVNTTGDVSEANGSGTATGSHIYTTAGAYTADSSLTGKATSGFVSRYKKGATTPTGQTQFQFRIANLNFHISSYQWLVIAGHKAMYKGIGTINGGGNYGFLISAIDEKLTPSTDVDLFRIKIWDKDKNDEIVYDNQMGVAGNEDPTTGIGGGSIVIHSK